MTDLEFTKAIYDDNSVNANHVHVSSDGTIYTHSHEDIFSPPMGNDPHIHTHVHSHNQTQTKAVSNRLARAIGHLESVKRMVESNRDCTDILIQLSAVQAALSNTAKIILKDHIQHCLLDIIEQDNQKALNDLNEAIERFMR